MLFAFWISLECTAALGQVFVQVLQSRCCAALFKAGPEGGRQTQHPRYLLLGASPAEHGNSRRVLLCLDKVSPGEESTPIY